MGHCFAHKALDRQAVLEFAARALFAAIFAAQHLQAVPLKMSGPILVASSGHAQVAIVLGEHPQESYQYAAAELARYLRILSGAEVKIISDAQTASLPANEAMIVVGGGDVTKWRRKRSRRSL